MRISPRRIARYSITAFAACASLAARAEGTAQSYSFLDIATSTHAYALGGSGAAVIADDVTLADQNPALLGPEIETQLALNYMHYLGDSNFAGARFGKAAGDHGAWAFGIRYLNYGSIEGFNPDGTASSSFTPQDMVFEGTYSRDISSKFRGGINLKGVYSTYEHYTAVALAVDLGVNYFDEDHDISLSLVARNLGGQVKKFDREGVRLPINLELAYMQGLGESPFSLAITAADLTHWRLPFYTHDTQNADEFHAEKRGFGHDLMRHLIFGLQYDPTENFYLALGYNYRTRTDMAAYHRSFLSGWSVGMGLNVRALRIGLAYAQPHKAGSTLMLNLSANLADWMR